MSVFTEAVLEKKLQDLNNSQQSIQTLSLWIIHHKKNYKVVVKLWLKELKKAKKQKKLVFIYLANDVIQNSKRKNSEYLKAFAPALIKALSNISAEKGKPEEDAKTEEGIKKVLKIWEERHIYDKSQMTKFQQAFSSKKPVPEEAPEASTSSSKHRSHSKKRKVDVVAVKPKEIEAPPGEPPDGETLVKALNSLENCASTDAPIREKIASLPPEVSDPTMLEGMKDKQQIEELQEKVSNAMSLLSHYNRCLSHEQEDRKQVSKMLMSYLHHQKALQVEADKQMEEYKKKLEHVNQIRSELKQHLQKLPDLSLLPNVTKGLAPLPSAGDLFSSKS